LDDVRARADPVGADEAPHADGQFFHRDRAAPGHVAGEPGPVGAEQRLPDARVHTVSADQHITVDLSRFEPQRDATRGLFETRALGV